MQIVRKELGLAPDDYDLDPRLMELSYGTWEGTLQDDVKTLDAAAFADREQDPYRWRPEGGESYADLFARVAGWAATAHPCCVVVSHGGVSRCLRAHALGLAPDVIPTLESPQDRILVLERGTMRWI
jgi:probable phosphoglycerate mutase